MTDKNLFEFYKKFQLYTSDEDELGYIFGLSTIEGIFLPKKQTKIKTNHRSDKKLKPIIQIYNSLDFGTYFLEEHEILELINKLHAKTSGIKNLRQSYKDDFQQEVYNFITKKKKNFEESVRNAGINLISRIQSQYFTKTKSSMNQDYNMIRYCFVRKKGDRR